MDRYLINAYFDLEEEKERRNFWLYLFLYGFSVSNDWPSIWFDIKAGKCAHPLEQRVSPGNNGLRAAVIVLQVVSSQGMLIATWRERGGLYITLVFTQEEQSLEAKTHAAFCFGSVTNPMVHKHVPCLLLFFLAPK